MSEFEGQATTPETQGSTETQNTEERNGSPADLSEGSEEGQEQLESKDASVNASKQEKEELRIIDYFKKNGELPKGVEAFRDTEDGKIKFVVPMDGKKYAVSFNQLIRGFNLEQTGKKRLDEAKGLEKQLEKVIGDIRADNPEGKKNLAKLLSKLGYDKTKIAEEWMADYLTEAQKSDEERARDRYHAEIEERERILKEREEALEADRSKGAVSQAQQRITAETIKALKDAKLEGIKPELQKRIMVKTFSKLYEDRLAKQGEDRPTLMTAKEALDDVLNEYQMVISDALSMYGIDTVKKRIPKDFIDVIMKESLNTESPRSLNSFEPKQGVEANEQTQTKTKGKGKILLSEWLNS